MTDVKRVVDNTVADKWHKVETDLVGSAGVRVFTLTTVGGKARQMGSIGAAGLAVQRVGSLAHAQLRFWLWHEQRPPGGREMLTITDAWDPARLQIATVRDAVARLLARHEALRTTYGLDADGRPQQRVCEPPVLLPSEVPAMAAGCVEQNVGLLRAKLGRREFALGEELPVRFALVVNGGRVEAVVAAFHHTIVDHHALTVLRHEFRALVSGRPLASGELRHPLDWAGVENSAAGRRQSVTALDELARIYVQIPHRTVFQPGHDPDDPDYRILRVTSQRAAADLREAARRHAVSEPSVLITAYLASLALVSGNRRVATRVGYSNRHLKNADKSVSCLVQDVVIHRDIEADMRCSTILKSVAQLCFRRYVSGHYPYDGAQERIAGVEHDRGVRLPIGTSINYIRGALGAGQFGVRRQQVFADHTSTDTVDWIDLADSPGYTHDLELLVFDELSLLTLEVNARTRAVPPASAEKLVAGMKRFLAGLADGTDPRLWEIGESAGIVTPVWELPWLEVDGCLVNLDEIRSLVRLHPDVIDCGIFTSGHPSTSLTAYVHAAPGLTAKDLRRFLLAQLDHNSAALVPHTFVFTSSRPEDPGSESDWRTQTIASSGSGREESVPRARLAEETTVGAIAVRLGALRDADPSRGYLEQGGRLAAAPAILRRLRDEAYEGLSMDDLLGHRSLSELSERLHDVAPRGNASATSVARPTPPDHGGSRSR